VEQSSFLHKKQSVRTKKVQIDTAFGMQSTVLIHRHSYVLYLFLSVSMISSGIVYRPLHTQLIYFGMVVALK